MKGLKTMIYEKSCGAVIFTEADGVRLYLIELMKQGHCSICKGHVEKNETEHQTAEREILEETGLSVKFIDGFRESIEYSPYEGCIKTVIFFLAGTESMDVTAQEEEVKEIKWLPFPEAMADLTFDSDRETLRKAEEFLRKIEL
jgi:tRNA nucleotidyltransferase (CCA-adding enzyme)